MFQGDTLKNDIYELSLNDMPLNIAVYKPTDDNNFIFVEFNKQAELTDKLSKDKVIGKKLTDVFPGVKSMGLFDVFMRVSKTGKEELFNLGHYGDNRISGWRKNKVSRLDNGLIFVVYEDLDDKNIEVETYGKQLDANIKEIEDLKEQMELALLGNHDGVWDWNLLDNSVYFSPRWKEILGYHEDELPNKLSRWEERIHPDDKELTMSLVHANIEGTTDYYESTHRLRDKNGLWIWVLARGKTIFDENGKAIRMIGTHTDITQKKAIELKYVQEAQMVEQTHDSIVSVDMQGIITSFNHGAELLLEYKADKIIGKHITKLHLKEDFEIFAQQIEILKKDEKYNNEIYLVKESGQVIDVNLSLSLLKDEKGKALGVVAYAQDITKRKLAERILRESEERFRSISTSAQDAIIMMDNEGKISYWNKAAEKIFGYTKQEVRGKMLSALIVPKKFFTAHNIGVENFKATGKGPVIGKTLELSGLKKNGIEFPVELSLSSLLKDGKWNAIGIIRDITERKEMQDKINELAFYDPLTKLPNRRLLDDRLSQTIAASKRSEKYAALVFLDLDNFKSLNDTYGHAVGDSLLIEAARRLRSCIREMDTVARVGGDEFVLIINELDEDKEKSRAEVDVLAKKVLSTLSAPYIFDINSDKASKIEYYCSASIGVSVFKADEVSEESLFQHADIAMYEAKKAGRNRICFYCSNH